MYIEREIETMEELKRYWVYQNHYFDKEEDLKKHLKEDIDENIINNIEFKKFLEFCPYNLSSYIIDNVIKKVKVYDIKETSEIVEETDYFIDFLASLYTRKIVKYLIEGTR